MIPKKRKYVVPGDVIVEGDFVPGPNTYRHGKRVIAAKVGIAEITGKNVRVLPIEGKYVPRQGDIVVGVVIDYNILSWTIDINSIFYGYLLAKDVTGKSAIERLALEEKLKIGDVIVAKILAFDLSRDPLLTLRGPGLGRIPDGEIIRISPVNVYRLIDKKEKLNKMIEEATKCKLIIGMNGVIVVRGPPDGVALAIKAIRLIDSDKRLEALAKNVRTLLNLGGEEK